MERVGWTKECARPLLAAALLLMALVIAYGNHFRNGFHFDDAHAIVTNPAIRKLSNVPAFFRDAATFSVLPTNQSYRPLVSTLFAFDYWLGGGLDPFWFHISIFALFVALVLLFAFVLHHLLEQVRRSRWNWWIAVVGAAFYGTNPANADTINYVIACSDVISTLGIVASFAVYFLFPAQRRFYFFVLPAALSILAKPPAIVFPVLLVLYLMLFSEGRPEAVAGRAPDRNRYSPLLWHALPAFLVCAAVLIFVQRMTPRGWVAGAMNPFGYLITQPYVALQYFRTFFWPADLSADYDLSPFSGFGEPRFWAGIAFVVALAIGAFVACRHKRWRVVGFGLVWFIIGLLPTSLFPLAEVMNDHRAFLPCLGLIIALAGAASILLEDFPLRTVTARSIAVSATVLLLFASAYGTFDRNRVWRDEESLWRDVIVKSPKNGRGLMNFGLTLMAKGDYQGALAYFQRALVFTPQYSFLFINLGIAEDAVGNPEVAEEYFRTALRLAPGLPHAYSFYARFLIRHSRQLEAQPLLRKAAELSPSDELVRDLLAEASVFSAESYLNLSLKLYREKRFEDSIAAARKALELRPGYAEAWNNIGAAYNDLGQFEKAAEACQEALKLKPDFTLARNNLKYAQERISRATK